MEPGEQRSDEAARDGKPKPRDKWDRADIIGKISVPIIAILVTFLINAGAKKRERDDKVLEIAVRVLQAPADGQPDSLRAWALSVFREATKGSYDRLPKEAAAAISQGARLPGTPDWTPPANKPFRVRILYSGANDSLALAIQDSLQAHGYPGTSARVNDGAAPNSPQVRYYYPEDRADAGILVNDLNRILRLNLVPSDQSTRPDAARHARGELHLYLP